MDFHALARRDLQALCKRNGIRANMANASMADALGELSKVDGVEEYIKIKQPAAVPEPAAKVAVAEEDARREKQGSPLPRGRRVTAKTTEVVKPDKGKGKEQEKADAKQETNRGEDDPALDVGRRGPSRRARPAPAVAAPTTKAAVEKASEVVKTGKGKEVGKADLNQESTTGVGRRGASRRARPAPAAAAPATEPETKEAAVEKQSPPPRPPRPEDGVKEDPKCEANKEDAPIQRAVRRGPSRRARAAVSASTAEPETKAAALPEQEKQGNPLPRARRVTSTQPEPANLEDNVEEKNKNQEKDNADVAVQGVGRRGPSRRARPAPVISEPAAEAAVEKPAAKSALEQLGSPLPRGRRMTVNVKSSAPISADGDEAIKGDIHREANKGTAPGLGLRRHGARGRARPEPALPTPASKVAAEEDAKIPRGLRGKAKQPELITLDSDEEEDKDELMLEGKEDVPARGVAQRGPSRRARPAPIEAPAMKKKDLAISTEETHAPAEAVLVRHTRVRKPTMKAAAEEKVSRRTRKTAATIPTLQNKKPQDEPSGTCYDLKDVEYAADPQNLEQIEEIDQPKQDDEEVPMTEDEMVMEPIVIRPTPVPKAVAVAEEKVRRRTTKKAAASATNSTLQKEKREEEVQAEDVPALASEETADLQNVVIEEPKENDEDVLMNDDEMLTEMTQADERHVASEETADLQNVVIEEPKDGDEDVLMNDDEMLMEMTRADERHVADEILMEESLEEPPVINQEGTGSSRVEEQECKDKSPVEEEQVDVEPCATLPGLEDSPVMGLVSMFSEQIVENEDEGVHVQEGSGPTEKRLNKEMDDDHHTDKEMQMAPIIQTLQEPFIAAVPVTEVGFTAHADHGCEIESSNILETTSVDGEDSPICQEKRDVAEDDEEVQPKMLPLTEMLMEESLEEEPHVVDQECTNNLAMEEQECKFNTTVPNLDDSPIFGLVSMFAEQTVENEKDEGAHLQEGSGSTDGRLDKELNEENHHAGKEMVMAPIIETLQVPLIAADPATEVGFTAHADHGSEMESSDGPEATLIDAEDCVICQEKRDVAEDDTEAQPKVVDEVLVLDCSRNLSSVVEEKAVETTVSELVQNEVVISNTVVHVSLIDGEGSRMEKVEQVTEELTWGLAQFFAEDGFVCQEKRDVAEDNVDVQPKMVDDAVVLDYSGNISSVAEEKAVNVKTMVSELIQNELVISNNVAQVTLIDGEGSGMEKLEQVTEELTWGLAQLFAEDGLICQEKQDVAEDNVDMQPKMVDGTVVLDYSGNISSVAEEKAVNVKTMVSELIQNEVVISNNVAQVTLIDGEGSGMAKLEQVTEELTWGLAQLFADDGLICQEKQDVAEDNVAVVLDCSGNISSDVEEKAVETMVSELVQNEVVISNNLTQAILIDGEGAGMEKTELLTEELTQGSAQLDGDVEGDDFQTDFVHADELKEFDEEKKAIELTEKMPQSIGTVDECIQEGYFQFGFVHEDELKKLITAENVLELCETEDVWKESAFTGDYPRELGVARDYTDNITSALLDDITETLSKITITETTGSTDDDIPICKDSSEDTAESVCTNNSEKNTEPVSKNKSENKVAELVAMQENMGGKVANKSAELSKLSIGQLKAKLKKTLEKNKRVALGRVDGNVCRSNTTGQQQVGNLQQD